MFTGIIETIGIVEDVQQEGANFHYKVKSDFTNELKVDQSVAHSGVCLTVTKIEGEYYWVTAVKETLGKTNLSSWKVGSKVNLERCMLNNGRFDGHIVQGHVDQVGTCTRVEEQGGSWLYNFEYDETQGNVTVEKGSITINGISLTCFNSMDNGFAVAIIPYTYEHTNMHDLQVGSQVNLEFDIVGKYVQRLMKG